VDRLAIDKRAQALKILNCAWQKLGLDKNARKQIFDLIKSYLPHLTGTGRAQLLESFLSEKKVQLDAIQFAIEFLPTLGSGTTLYQKVAAVVQEAMQFLPPAERKHIIFPKQKP